MLVTDNIYHNRLESNQREARQVLSGRSFEFGRAVACHVARYFVDI
jgi:hypothetical protein